MKPKRWRQDGIPTLYTPINSINILRQKRLVIVVLLSEKNKQKQENFAYINIPLKDLNPIEQVNAGTGEKSWDYEILAHDLPVIGNNRVLGKFQAVINFRVNGRQMADEEIKQEEQVQPTLIVN